MSSSNHQQVNKEFNTAKHQKLY